MNREAVNHPDHYGGDTLYETIKVLEAWLPPEQFLGFLRGNAIKYQSRAGKKGDPLQDLEKAAFYTRYEAEFRKRMSDDEDRPSVLERVRVFWTERMPEPHPDPYEVIHDYDVLEIIPVHSNVEPHVRWFVQFPISDEGDTDIGEFYTLGDALKHISVLTANANKALKETEAAKTVPAEQTRPSLTDAVDSLWTELRQDVWVSRHVSGIGAGQIEDSIRIVLKPRATKAVMRRMPKVWQGYEVVTVKHESARRKK